jgi:hypothetical protein
MGEDELPPRDDLADDDKGEDKHKRLFDIPDALRRAVERAVETGVGKLVEGPENLRHLVGELKLPKEVLQYIYHQVDESKNDLYRIVAREIRDVLEHTQFAEEITKVLTKLSFEIRTEIRFVPNEASKAAGKKDEAGRATGARTDETGAAGESLGLPKPEVSAQVTLRDRSKEPRR